MDALHASHRYVQKALIRHSYHKLHIFDVSYMINEHCLLVHLSTTVPEYCQQEPSLTCHIICQDKSNANHNLELHAGKLVTLYKTVYTQGVIRRYSWTRNNYILSDTLITKTNITLRLFDYIVVSDSGYNITLNINSFQDTDVGQYTLEVCNDVGCGIFSSTLYIGGF